MELKTGYKQTDVGMIPSDWEVKTLKDLSLLITKGTTPKQFSEAGINYIKIESLLGDNISIEKCLFIEESIHKTELKRSILNEGDLLFAIAGATIGKCTFVQKEVIPANTNQALAIIRLKGEENKTYVFYFLKSILMQKYIVDNIAGGAQPNLNLAQIGGFSFPVPPTKAEQSAIATALSDTDQYITHLEKLIAKKRNIKQGAMQELLNPKKGWGMNTYGEIFDFLTTATYSRADLSETGEIGYVHYGDIHTKWKSFLDFEKHRLPTISKNQLKNYPILREGDIIMADASEDYSGVGESIEVKNLGDNKSISGLHTFLLRDKKGVFVNGFKGYIHKSKIVKSQIEKLASGLKVYGISKYNLKAVQVPIPPIEEQTRISTILSDMDAEIATLETKLAKAKSIKQGMMQQLLTGKIRLV